MTSIVLHTNVLSPYGWTARLVAAEKGVSHEVRPVDTSSPAHLRLHPFGKMPVLQHGDVVVYETLAIAHYIDRAFDGPALQPAEVLGQTEVLRWISVVNGYVFPVMNGLIKERVASLWRDTPPDEAVLEALKAPLADQVGLIDRTLSDHAFLVGDRLTLADCFLFPHLHFAAQTPEGVEALGSAAAARRWLDGMRARPSVNATSPFAEPAA